MPESQVFVDVQGRKYTVEHIACAAGIGRISKNVHVLYEDGSRAVLSETYHQEHCKPLSESLLEKTFLSETHPRRCAHHY